MPELIQFPVQDWDYHFLVEEDHLRHYVAQIKEEYHRQVCAGGLKYQKGLRYATAGHSFLYPLHTKSMSGGKYNM